MSCTDLITDLELTSWIRTCNLWSACPRGIFSILRFRFKFGFMKSFVISVHIHIDRMFQLIWFHLELLVDQMKTLVTDDLQVGCFGSFWYLAPWLSGRYNTWNSCVVFITLAPLTCNPVSIVQLAEAWEHNECKVLSTSLWDFCHPFNITMRFVPWSYEWTWQKEMWTTQLVGIFFTIVLHELWMLKES